MGLTNPVRYIMYLVLAVRAMVMSRTDNSMNMAQDDVFSRLYSTVGAVTATQFRY